jgi:hypothetical protein
MNARDPANRSGADKAGGAASTQAPDTRDARAKSLESPTLRRLAAAQPLDFPPITWPASAEPAGETAAPDLHQDGGEFSFPPAPPALPAKTPPRRTTRGLVWGPPVELNSQAQRWIRSIPRTARPRQLADQYPHVINRLAIAWGDHVLVERCFDELMIDRRGDRGGFPKAISAEILALHGHYLSMFDRKVRFVNLGALDDAHDDVTEPMPLEWRGR